MTFAARLPRRLHLARRGDVRRCHRRRAGARAAGQGAAAAVRRRAARRHHRLPDLRVHAGADGVAGRICCRVAGFPVGAAMLLSSAYGFAQADAKVDTTRPLLHRASRRTGTSWRCISTCWRLPPIVNAAHPAGARRAGVRADPLRLSVADRRRCACRRWCSARSGRCSSIVDDLAAARHRRPLDGAVAGVSGLLHRAVAVATRRSRTEDCRSPITSSCRRSSSSSSPSSSTCSASASSSRCCRSTPSRSAPSRSRSACSAPASR